MGKIKKLSIVLLLLLLTYTSFSQTPEWMIIDLQQSMQYESIKSFFGIDLDKEEIVEISFGEYGRIWFTTQNYKIKYLPNSIVLYPFHDIERPLCSLTNSNVNNFCYSQIFEKEIAEKYPQNSWLEYEHLLENDLANKRITGSYLEKYIVTYELNNYSAPISFDREISFEEFSTYFLTNYPRFLIELSSQQHSKKSINKSFLSASDKLNYVNTFKSRYCGEHIFDVDKDAFGNTWTATGKNLIRLNGDKFFVQDIPAITLESDDCYLWIGTAAYNSVGSLIKFDGENFIYYNYLNSPLPDNAGILDIKKDNAGNLWIAMKRKGIPGKLENNLVAVFNEAGINLRDVVGLQSSVFVRNYISIGGRKFLTDKLYINYNTDGLRASESLDFYLNDDLIYSAYSDENISENQEFVFEHTLLHQRKYDMKNYLNDSVQNKIELNHFSLDVRFNDLGFFLEQNTPNPFSKHTIIEYGYLQDKYYSVKVFDIFDRFIDESVEASMAIWGQPLIFKAGENPNGIYFYYLVEKNRGVIDAKKMVLFDPEKIITLPH